MVLTASFRVALIENFRYIIASILSNCSLKKYFNEKRNRYFDILI